MVRVLAIGLITFLSYCSSPPASNTVIKTNTTRVIPEPRGNASITGVISLKGGAPFSHIDMSSDPVCEDANRNPPNVNPFLEKGRTETVVVNNSWKLVNVLVFLKSEQLDSSKTSAPADAQFIGSKDCYFVPHVLGLQKDQPVLLRNNDQTEHEYCLSPAYNPPWCVTLKPGETSAEKKFTAPERFIQLSCRRHPWEESYLAVFDHPFFSVSDNDGKYEIKGIPPGEYTVVAWHEYYGERTSRITIGPNQTKTVDFTIDWMVSAEDLAKPIKKSEVEMMESALHKVEPVYPERAGRFRQDGKAEVRVMLDEEGNVTHAFGLAGHPVFEDSAVVAAQGWKFKPTIRNGVPVKVAGSIIFYFKTPEHIQLPSATHYEMSESDKVNQFFGPLTYPFTVTIDLNSKNWKTDEPLVVDAYFKNTTDKIVLLDLKRRYYFIGHLTDRLKRTYGVVWDNKGSGGSPQQEDYTELAPGATHKVTLTSMGFLDADGMGRKTPWNSHTAGRYKLAVFYVTNSKKPLVLGEWVGQAMSNEVEVNVR